MMYNPRAENGLPNGCCHPPANHDRHVEHTRDAEDRLASIEALLVEYERTCDPAPYTSERALYERLRSLIPPTSIHSA